MSTVEKWLTGVTTLAVVATIFTSRYAAGILRETFGGIGSVYRAAKG